MGHFGSSVHQPKWIGIGSLLSSVACFGLASPVILFANQQTPPIANETTGKHLVTRKTGALETANLGK